MLNSVELTTGRTKSPKVILMPMVISRMEAAAAISSHKLGNLAEESVMMFVCKGAGNKSYSCHYIIYLISRRADI